MVLQHYIMKLYAPYIFWKSLTSWNPLRLMHVTIYPQVLSYKSQYLVSPTLLAGTRETLKSFERIYIYTLSVLYLLLPGSQATRLLQRITKVLRLLLPHPKHPNPQPSKYTTASARRYRIVMQWRRGKGCWERGGPGLVKGGKITRLGGVRAIEGRRGNLTVEGV